MPSCKYVQNICVVYCRGHDLYRTEVYHAVAVKLEPVKDIPARVPFCVLPNVSLTHLEDIKPIMQKELTPQEDGLKL